MRNRARQLAFRIKPKESAKAAKRNVEAARDLALREGVEGTRTPPEVLKAGLAVCCHPATQIVCFSLLTKLTRRSLPLRGGNAVTAAFFIPDNAEADGDAPADGVVATALAEAPADAGSVADDADSSCEAETPATLVTAFAPAMTPKVTANAHGR